MNLFSRNMKNEKVPSSETDNSEAVPISFRKRWFRRFGRFLLFIVLGYCAILLIGLIPTNNDFKETPDGIKIFIASNGVHADLIVPLETEIINWNEYLPSHLFEGDITEATYAGFGWGDKGFYVETPTWDDFKISTALNALFSPSPCCMHVVMQMEPKTGDSLKAVKISREQYKKMVEAIQESMKVDTKNKYIPIPNSSYHQYDTFFEAHGNYHVLNTCNSWVGSVMRKSEIRTPLLTPIPGTVFLYLPE